MRLVLAEKGVRRGPDVPWQSDSAENLSAPEGTYIGRPVSLPRQENLSEAYAAIHPHLVVPALVHDGVLHIESVDIMSYIDHELPGPALVPEGDRGDACQALVARASKLQVSVRHVTYRWSLGGLAKLSPRKQAELRNLDSPDSPERLAEFYARFSNGEISEREFADHVTSLSDGFKQIEALLGDGRTWLCGEEFSMADIIWTVKVHRLDEAGYPFAASFPRIKTWFDRARSRESFREAIGRDTGAASRFMRVRGAVQNLFGRGLRSIAIE